MVHFHRKITPGASVGTVWVFAILVLIWWVLDGPHNLMVGLVAAALGSGMFLALRSRRSYSLQIIELPRFVAYFIIESFRGGMDIALRALNPRLPIHPHLFDHPIVLPAGPPKALLIGVISLLPGTLSADLSDDGTLVRVHAINEDPEPAIEELEHRIARLFALNRGSSC